MVTKFVTGANYLCSHGKKTWSLNELYECSMFDVVAVTIVFGQLMIR